MPEPYKPEGSTVTYTVPSLDDPADGPQAFRDFADSIPTALSPAIAVHNKSADYTLAMDDDGALVGFDCTAKDLNVTVPAHGKVNFPVGSVIVVGCFGTNRKGSLTIIAEDGVTLRDLAVRKVLWSRMAALIKIDQDSWIINAGTGGGTPTSVPSPPKLLTAAAGSMQVGVTWQAPTDDGGSALSAYLVEISQDQKTWNTGASASPNASGSPVPVPKEGLWYFRVKAANANGVSEPSNVLSAEVKPPFNEASGGGITYFTKDGKRFRRHTFTSGGTLKVIRSVQPFTLFAVGGGGGGGGGGIAEIGYGGMPGGSGGAFNKEGVTLPEGDIPVAVGDGGQGKAWYAAGTKGGNSSIGGYLVCGGGGGGNFANPPDSAWKGQPTPGNPGSEGGTSTGGTGGGGQTPTTNPAPPVLQAKGLPTSIGAGGYATGQDSGGAPGGPGTPGIVLVEYEVAPE